jgi:phosphoglycerate dehydrogenase-like enzyme
VGKPPDGLDPRSVRVAADSFYREGRGEIPGGVEIEWFESFEDVARAVSTAQVLALGQDRGWPIAEVIADAPQLQWVHTRAAGVDRGQLQPLALFRDRGITVTNGSGLSSIPIGEYVAMAILAIEKGLPQLLAAQNSRQWAKPPSSRALGDTRALVLGFGSVGRAVWERLRPFGVSATAVRRTPSVEADIEVIGPTDWRGRLGEFDWIILTAPLIDDTRHMVGSPELAAMKRDAWLINVARGGIVDQSALVAVLRERSIGGAFLDVTEPEPLPTESELWGLPNVIITPHCSSNSPLFPERATELFFDNLRRWCAREQLRNVVDLNLGY